MRRLIFAVLLAVASMLILDCTPASACWYGYNTYCYWARLHPNTGVGSAWLALVASQPC
jgi:hypothetical protein